MTGDEPDLEPIDLSLGAPAAAATPPGPYGAAAAAPPPAWAPGWYADPWTAGQYRYWNGQAWTGETNRWGPATGGGAGPGGATDPWPASATTATPAAGGYGWSDPVGGVPPAAGSPRARGRGPVVAAIVGLVIVLIASAGVGYAINSRSHGHSAVKVAPTPTTPGSTTPGTPGRVAKPDPDRRALNGLVVRQSDVNPVRTVGLIPNGNQLSEPTLDLCNGTYASEALRTARLQVADVDTKGDATLGTEAVLYRNADASKQAFSELRRVSASCPHSPVTSPVGEGTATTVFHPAPDATWKSTPGIDRLAYSVTTTPQATGSQVTVPGAGRPSSSIAVYLRRGRALLGLYFPKPTGVQPVVAGQRSIEGIVGVFAARLAALPESVVNGAVTSAATS